MTPTPKVIAYAVVCVLILAGVLAVVSFLSDPFGIKSWWNDRQEVRHERVESNAVARTLESEGNAAQVQRVETFHRQTITVRDLTAQSVNEARSAPDANEPIDPARFERLRAADRELCDTTGLCAAAPPDAS